METIVLSTFGSCAWVTGAFFVYWFIDVIIDMFLGFIKTFD